MVKRTAFGQLTPVIEPPNLIDIQVNSYQDVLQVGIPPAKRLDQGLQAIFREIFPIESYDGRFTLDFVKYDLVLPKAGPLEALYEGNTYAATLNVTFRLKDGEEVREEDVYMAELPLMTDDGAFIINGAERVIVSQLHRSPGICSEKSLHPNGSTLFSIRIIPDRGSWIEIQFDTADLMWVYMDRRRRRRKFLVTTFLRALGYSSDADILNLFYEHKTVDVRRAVESEELENLVFPEDVRDPDTQAPLARRYEGVTEPILRQMAAAGIQRVELIDISADEGVLLETLRADQTTSEEEALRDIYLKLRPGDPATASNAKQLIKRYFFDPRRYDLGRVGRYKINQKLGLHGKVDAELRVLDNLDVIAAVKHLISIRTNKETVDDIDHLGNRRVRTSGELIENQCRIGLARTERLIRERMTLFDPAQGALSPQRLVNSKSLSAVILDFFGRSQLSQFMDQTNPLSGLAHKRRLSALGPGGLSRDRAGFEVRDVHSSHYGRICPIETPEGPNIGLISSLGIYAKVNDFGFIESPYRKVVDGRVTDEVVYLSADEEEKYVIAQANAPLNPDGHFANSTVSVRYDTEFLGVPRERVQFMDVSPMQLVSIAASMIPFLEHDDANRALMGANMMRQAVPLLRAERPYVATGLEKVAARDSKVVLRAEQSGVVEAVDASTITVVEDSDNSKRRSKRKATKKYALQKFRRTNAGTCFNQKPLVEVGQRIDAGEVIADGPATSGGELALGKNLLVAFMPWCGYNFEDAILVSERIVRDDIFTSVHIVDFECSARETKLGPEEITRDIPNVGEEALRNLGPDGVIRVGAEVKPGDILVGKITPKSETELAPEERLLRAIFGEKAADVRDTSLTVPSGTYGIVMDVKTSQQRDLKRPGNTAAALAELASPLAPPTPPPPKRTMKDVEAELVQRRVDLKDELTLALSNILLGEKVPVDVLDADSGEILIPANRKITKAFLVRLTEAYDRVDIETGPVQEKIDGIIEDFHPRFADAEARAEAEREQLASGDDDPPGMVKSVRVFIASKKNLSVGDKLAGRHGNKGVVARVLPECDMPFLPNGQPMDIVLNPLGVPSRMNLGQVFETHLGAACRALGMYAGTPVFDGITEEDVCALLEKGAEKPGYEWMAADGKTVLYDGRTGEPFDQRVVVGQIYMMKLHHLVTDKIHARAVGPYSLVTQQPLGGKAQYGGQRMGEMEVWALEAYGVAYALQELLTVKSDDVAGRTRIYESIVKGQNVLQAGMPESFAVLINELRGLCLNMQLKKHGQENAVLFS